MVREDNLVPGMTMMLCRGKHSIWLFGVLVFGNATSDFSSHHIHVNIT